MRYLLMLATLALTGMARAASDPALLADDPGDGTTPLHWAVYRSDVAAVKRLLASGANVNAQND